jgi:hypothetical protein
MPNLRGFGKHEGQMKKAMQVAGDALLNANMAYIEDEDAFKKRFQKYFGKMNDSAKDDIVANIANMNGQFTRNNFNVSLGPANANENANMTHFSSAGYQFITRRDLSKDQTIPGEQPVAADGDPPAIFRSAVHIGNHAIAGRDVPARTVALRGRHHRLPAAALLRLARRELVQGHQSRSRLPQRRERGLLHRQLRQIGNSVWGTQQMRTPHATNSVQSRRSSGTSSFARF